MSSSHIHTYGSIDWVIDPISDIISPSFSMAAIDCPKLQSCPQLQCDCKNNFIRL